MSVDLDAACPDDEDILGFVERTLSGPAREAIASHIEACAACREVLANMAPAIAEPTPEGGTAGRYELLSTLGAGGMGIVQAAFDQQLGRKVALKFLVSDPGEDDERARARLQREARALAQLAHPNVITVHDVGVLDGDVFVAMELVDGENLREWLRAAPRTLKAKLAVLRQAGEGLAAAHAAGIVHRDFKPENVLVGRDGRTRVTDFGLARAIDVETEANEVPGPETPAARAQPVTRTGVHAGTPAYMAPEQKLGRAADARSDVYSYCVTLHEAVTGSRPREGATATARAPRWLERVMARGLRERPEERWPSMRALLDVLARGPRLTTGRVATALVAAALLTFSLVHGRASDAPKLCAPDPAAFAGVWDEPQRGAVRAAFRAADPSNAEPAFATVDDALGRMRDRWVAMRAESCTATRVRRDESEAVLDLRTGCLDTARAKAGALVQVLAKADRVVVDNAGTAVADLPAVDDCANVRALAAIDPPPADPAKRAVIDDAEAKLAQATALHHTGKETEALALVEPTLAAVRSAGYGPLEAKLLVLRADALMELGGTAAQNEQAMHEAAQRALDVRDDGSAAAAWILLAWQRYGLDGRLWADYAEAAITRLGGDDFLEADRCTRVAQIALTDGHWDEARALFERAKPLFERTRGPDYYRIGSILDGFGQVASLEQNFEEALRYHRLGLELRVRVVGRDNVATASSMFNEQEDLVAMGRLADAAVALDGLDARYARAGDTHVGYLEMTHGVLERARGNFAAALRHDRAGYAAYRLELAPGDRTLVNTLIGQGLDHLGLKRAADALAPLEEARTLTDGIESPQRADILFALAQALDGARRDRPRAQSLAWEAEGLLEPLAARYAGGYASKRAQVLDWLRSRS